METVIQFHLVKITKWRLFSRNKQVLRGELDRIYSLTFLNNLFLVYIFYKNHKKAIFRG